jgi:hypothetical protein
MKQANMKTYLLAGVLLYVATAWGLTRMNSVALWNSTVDNTPIGNTTASTVKATTVSASSGFTGNVAATSGVFGNIVIGCSGCGGTAWNPGTLTSGSWISFGNNGGSNQETDVINRYVSGVGGFSWWTPTGTSLTSQIMNLNTSGTLTVNAVNATLNGNTNGTHTGSNVGNSSTASSLASAPGGCGSLGQFTGGINANGTPINCQTSVYSQKGTVTVPAETFSNSSVTHFTVGFAVLSVPTSGAVVICTPQGDFGDEVQYTCWASGSTLNIKITHGTVGLPYTSNSMNVNFMVMQP